jgi:hypothetical protein
MRVDALIDSLIHAVTPRQLVVLSAPPEVIDSNYFCKRLFFMAQNKKNHGSTTRGASVLFKNY